MRTTAIFAVTLAAGCAGSASSTVEYDRLAPIIGRSVATPGAGGEVGALADALMIARGGLPVGFDPGDGIVTGAHDGLRYTYAVFCEDASGATMTCSPATHRAYAFAQWDSPALHRAGMWQLERLQGAEATATGTSTLDHDTDGFTITDVRRETLGVDLGSYAPAQGSIEADLRVTTDGEPVMVRASVTFTSTRTALLVLDGNTYWLDPATGATTSVVIQFRR